MQEEKEIAINNEILKNLASARIMKGDHKTDINSLDFSKDGTLLITCDDTAINLYDTQTGKKNKTLYNKTKKIDLVRFTHSNEAVLCCTKLDYKILYWSIHENEIIKIFSGHNDVLLSLEINNIDDIFLSTSKDQTLKLWNLDSNDDAPEAVLDLSSKNTTAIGNFDPSGLVMAVVYPESKNGNTLNVLRLYDLKKYEEGSFESWNYSDIGEIKMIKFSNNGQLIVCGTSENCIILIDAFKGTLMKKFTSFANENSLSIEVSFTPDSNYIVSGSENGLVHIWDIKSGEEIIRLEGHIKSVRCVKFSPTHLLLASGCKNVILWMPKEYPKNY